MDYEIVWTESAAADFEDAVRGVAARDPAGGEALRVELVAAVAVLKTFPRLGPAYERDRTGRTREILCRNYRIFYRVDDPARRVEIHRVWLGTRREPRIPG